MTQQEINEGNKLIAEFHGAKSDGYSSWIFEKGLLNEGLALRQRELIYHISWDWLMPVVEKIAIDYDVSIRWFDTDCSCSINNTSIEGTAIADFGNFTPAITNVWLAVIEFIKFHNQNQ